MGENYDDLTMAYKYAFPHAHRERDPTKYLLMWRAARVYYIRKRLRGQWNPEQHKPPPKFYIDPNGTPRRIWDMFLLLFVVFNALEVPFVVGLAPPPLFSLAMVDNAINFLFAVDIVLNFFTAVAEGGRSGEARGGGESRLALPAGRACATKTTH